jgi:hypothetical protein
MQSLSIADSEDDQCAPKTVFARATPYSILHCSDLQLDPAASLEATVIRLASRSLGEGWSFVIRNMSFAASSRPFPNSDEF